MKIVGKITNYIIVYEVSDFQKICYHILNKKEEKLLLSLPIKISELIGLDSESIPFDQDDIDCFFREYYWDMSPRVIGSADFILFKKDSSYEKQGVYQVKLTHSGKVMFKAMLLKKLDALTIEEFLKASSGIFLDRDTFGYRLKDYQTLLNKFERSYFDAEETTLKEPQSLFNQVSCFLLKNSALFYNFKLKLLPEIHDRISILEIKSQLAKHINEFSSQSIGIDANDANQVTNMYFALSKLIEDSCLVPPILFLEEFKEEKNSKSRYFSVYMIQKSNGVVYADTLETLKISNVDDRCIFYIKESFIDYSEQKSLELLQVYLKAAKSIAVDLLPRIDKPLAQTYKLAIERSEELVGVELQGKTLA